MMMNTICYKLKSPIYYNKGTKYETTCDTFLSYYTHLNDEEAQEEAKRLNTEKPDKLWNGKAIDWAEIDYFFVHKQDEMY